MKPVALPISLELYTCLIKISLHSLKDKVFFSFFVFSKDLFIYETEYMTASQGRGKRRESPSRPVAEHGA